VVPLQIDNKVQVTANLHTSRSPTAEQSKQPVPHGHVAAQPHTPAHGSLPATKGAQDFEITFWEDDTKQLATVAVGPPPSPDSAGEAALLLDGPASPTTMAVDASCVLPDGTQLWSENNNTIIWTNTLVTSQALCPPARA
jgi:hypothetical protein